MEKAIIVAFDLNHAIGYKNQLPWHMPADMKYFKNTTLGHTIIMGRKTFESIGSKPLPHRTNIVLSRTPQHTSHPNCYFFTSLEKALEKAENIPNQKAFIIGGSEIYKNAIPLVDILHITLIHTHVKADTYFPPIDYTTWTVVNKETHKANPKNPHDYTFIQYQRNTHALPPQKC